MEELMKNQEALVPASKLHVLGVNTSRPSAEEDDNRVASFKKIADLPNSEMQLEFASIDEYAAGTVLQPTDIILPIPFVLTNAEYSKLEELTKSRGAICFEPLQNVLGIDSMQKSYPLFQKAGIPTPKSVILSFPEEIKEYIQKKDILSFHVALNDMLNKILKNEGLMPSKNRKVFVKTFKRSHKKSIDRNIVGSMDGIIGHIWDLLQTTDMGTEGMAIREAAELEPAFYMQIRNECKTAFREYRFYVIGGMPVCWAFYYGLFKPNQRVIEKCMLTGPELQKMTELAQKSAEHAPSHFYTIDFAVLKNKDIIAIETNAGYSSGSKKETSPAVQAALLDYLKLVKKDPQMIEQKPDKRFKQFLDFDKWEQIRSQIAGQRKYWGTLANWIK